jgi:micrococcal nuclease
MAVSFGRRLSGPRFVRSQTRCDDGTRIRIHGIDAPEMDTAQGSASSDALQALIVGRTVACDRKGTSYNRIVATCFLDGQDIAALMVEQVMARDCPR